MLSEGFDPDASPDAATRFRIYNSLREVAGCPVADLDHKIIKLATPDAQWRVSHPLNEFSDTQSALTSVWWPLKQSFPDLERRDVIFVAGQYQGRCYIAAVGHYCGTMRGDWLGIPAIHKTVYLRYGEVYQLGADGRVIQANLLWDVLDLMKQAGFDPLAPSLGVERMWPGPIGADGIRLNPSDPLQSVASIEQTLAMHKTLAEHDDRARLSRDNLMIMPQREHWHEKMMWYGPAGIGTTRGLDGFVDGHQLPFRVAFHRPQGTFEQVTAERQRHGAGHYIRIGDGPYSVTGGWPSVYAMHLGGGFCGLPPSGKPVFMRVMDFYLHDEGLIRENWVPLDMLHLLHQMGVDLLARMREMIGPSNA